MKQIFIAVQFILLTGAAQAQDNIGLKFMGLSIHPFGDENAPIMPRRLDDRGVLVINLGGMLSYEKFVHKERFSVKAIQALYADCADRLGGFTHLGIRGKIFKTAKHSVYGGIGPTLVYRRNWAEIPGYIDPNYFDGAKHVIWQYKFIWYAGEFEYSYKLSPKIELATTFVPGYPKLISFSFGVKYLFQNRESTPETPR